MKLRSFNNLEWFNKNPNKNILPIYLNINLTNFLTNYSRDYFLNIKKFLF